MRGEFLIMIPPGFNNFWGGHQRPHLRRLRARVVYDSQGNPTLQPLSGEEQSSSPEDCINILDLDPDAFLDGCGCNAKTHPPALHCGHHDCSRVVCAEHASFCAACNKPLCRPHLYFLELPDHQRVALCPTHYEELRRRRFWKKVTETVLSPFVKFNHPDNRP